MHEGKFAKFATATAGQTSMNIARFLEWSDHLAGLQLNSVWYLAAVSPPWLLYWDLRSRGGCSLLRLRAPQPLQSQLAEETPLAAPLARSKSHSGSIQALHHTSDANQSYSAASHRWYKQSRCPWSPSTPDWHGHDSGVSICKEIRKVR